MGRHRHRIPRRPDSTAAAVANLPTSRLPLGTSLSGYFHALRPSSSASSRATARSVQSDLIDYPSESEHSPPVPSPSDAHQPSPAMSRYSFHQHHLSTAEDKLRRQQERNLLADAALSAAIIAPPSDRSFRPHSRGSKVKTKWAPVDIAWNIGNSQLRETRDQEGDTRQPPVAQTRVNTYMSSRHPRDASVARSSVSAASHQTGSIEMERQDSFDDTGFQTYRRGRTVKPKEELKPFEDNKQEVPQKTVEATFDKREIYEVFENELPQSLDYLNGLEGYRDSQVQFLQHPNGDVSAHMWVYEKFMWINIGSYSNIRKRIEGQLATDRLVGETADQTLQRNTLSYFRTIAKQKEQLNQKHPWGQKEIVDFMSSSKNIPKEDKKSAELPEPMSTVAASELTAATSTQQQQVSRRAPAPLAARPIPTGPRYSTAGWLDSQLAKRQQPVARSDDPSRHAPPPPPGLLMPTAAKAGSTTTSSMGPPPKPAVAKEKPTLKAPEVPRATPSLSVVPLAALSQNDNVAIMGASSQQSSDATSSSTVPRVDIDLLPVSAERQRLSFEIVEPLIRTKPLTPLEQSTREELRDRLIKLGESASKRSLSQANIRTVLYDPFHNIGSENGDSPSNADTEETRHRGQEISQPLPTQGSKHYENIEALSKWAEAQTCETTSFAHDQSTDGGTFDAESSAPSKSLGALSMLIPPPPHIPPSVELRNPLRTAEIMVKADDELEEWWNSGNKFSRQEEFYQSLRALQLNSTVDNATPSSRPRPIGAPAVGTHNQPTSERHQQSPSAPDHMTRILIPVYENLSSYTQGPAQQRRDYWSNWTQPPEWCIDHGPNGNASFFDSGGWVNPPARVGRDPRFRPLPGELRFGNFSPGAGRGSPARTGGHILASPMSGGRRYGFAGTY